MKLTIKQYTCHSPKNFIFILWIISGNINRTIRIMYHEANFYHYSSISMTIHFQSCFVTIYWWLANLIRIVQTVEKFLAPSPPDPSTSNKLPDFQLYFPLYFFSSEGSRQDIPCWRYPPLHHHSLNKSTNFQLTCRRLPLILYVDLQYETSGFQLSSST